MREAFSLQQEPLLESLQRKSMSATIILSFKPQPQTDVRRLKVQPVSADIARICRQLQGSV
jgi:hypothetical protein